VSNHFPFWPTLDRLVEVISYVLGLHFQNVTEAGAGGEGLERCHPSVRIYAVGDVQTGKI
jgi:hypothetical protein